MSADHVPYLFLVLGAVFAGLAWHSHRTAASPGDAIAVKIRLRMAVVFCLMALLIGLFKQQ